MGELRNKVSDHFDGSVLQVPERRNQRSKYGEKSQIVAIAGNFNQPNFVWDCQGAKGLNEMEFVKCFFQEGFVKQYVEDPTRGGNIRSPIGRWDRASD